jgi:AraC family transcriptional regulator of adaptative response/methylated-DNA-[protein]-cysteine methyltransferase
MSSSDAYDRIAQALQYLDAHREEKPTLEQVAEHVQLSPFHFQRLFRSWAGISPKRFLQFLTITNARRCLEEARSVLDATFEAGLSSPGRLHDLFVAVEAVTPGEYKRRGAGVTIRYGVQDSPFGTCLIGSTDRGVCWLSFHDEREAQNGMTQLAETWMCATLQRSDEDSATWRDRIFDARRSDDPRPLPLLVRGTNFQLKVWEALIRVPAGLVCSYQDLARWIGRPTATRAAASAVAVNPVAYLIPCHRVIRSIGQFGEYRWGAKRKKAMIGWEMATADLEAV